MAYDSFKDNVKDSSSRGSSTPEFKTLKQDAQENTSEDDNGDDTPIEVPEDGLSRSKNTDSVKGSQYKDTESVHSAALEKKMDRLIEQNDRIIQILESFGS